MITATQFAARCDLAWVIAQLEAIPDSEWRVDTVRHADPTGRTTNCVMGHIFDLGGGDQLVTPPTQRMRTAPGGGLLWDWFEEQVATTYMIFPVNDGRHPGYQQPAPKQRCLAYLKAIQAGTEPSTQDHLARNAG